MIYATDPNAWMRMLDRPLEQRLAPAPDALLDFVGRYEAAHGNAIPPRAAAAPEDFLADVQAAIAELPAVVKGELASRLLGVYFVAGIASSAATDVVAFGDGTLIGSFVLLDVDAMIGRTANEWATWNQNTPFRPAPGVALEAVIAAPADDHRKTAIQFVLLHEFGHVLTAGRDLAPDWWLDAGQYKEEAAYRFLPLAWRIGADGRIAPRPEDDFPLRDQVRFYGDRPLSAECIPAIYRHLGQTQFPSLYASSSVHEDFADSFATYVHAVLLGRPYTVTVRQDGMPPFLFDFWATPRSAPRRAFFDAFFGGLAEIPVETPYLGLAPFLRASIAGEDLRGTAQQLLVEAHQCNEDANLWMNLATAFFSIGQRELGLAIQGQALMMSRLFTLQAACQPTRRRLLALMAPGDLAENTPLDCLLEDSDIELLYYYASSEAPLPAPLPEHDALIVAMSERCENRGLLNALETLLAGWPRPVFNRPEYIPNTDRGRASQLLQGIPGLFIPLTHRLPRQTLQAIADGEQRLEDSVPGCAFPVILRPLGSQAGRGLARIAAPEEIGPYLEQVGEPEFFLARFVDYSDERDGLFRKFRVVLVRGVPFASHMAISSHWIIHYLNAGMYENAAKRAEEAAFLENFGAFARRHAAALEAIHRRTQLDYLCIDCAETRGGELLIFEIDHTAVVHAMDSAELFPFKPIHIRKVQRAFADMLGDSAELTAGST